MTTRTPSGAENLASTPAERQIASYLDGEISAAEALEIETELGRNPVARDRLEKMRRDGVLLRAAFDESLAEPLPERVLKTLEAATEPARKGHAVPSWISRILSPVGQGISWPYALAGSLATFLFGLFVSYQLLDARITREFAAFSAQQEQDQALHNAALAAALEEYVSGQSASWHNPESGNSGEITPIRTFKNPEGTWCREYASQEIRGSLQETRQAIACRESDGRWQTRIVILQDS